MQVRCVLCDAVKWNKVENGHIVFQQLDSQGAHQLAHLSQLISPASAACAAKFIRCIICILECSSSTSSLSPFDQITSAMLKGILVASCLLSYYLVVLTRASTLDVDAMANKVLESYYKTVNVSGQ